SASIHRPVAYAAVNKADRIIRGDDECILAGTDVSVLLASCEGYSRHFSEVAHDPITYGCVATAATYERGGHDELRGVATIQRRHESSLEAPSEDAQHQYAAESYTQSGNRQRSPPRLPFQVTFGQSSCGAETGTPKRLQHAAAIGSEWGCDHAPAQDDQS